MLLAIFTLFAGQNLTFASGVDTNSAPRLIVVLGAGGEEEFQTQFENWTRSWEVIGKEAGANLTLLGLEEAGTTNTNTLSRLDETLRGEPAEASTELWLILIGHGTFDGKEAKFNVAGPDLTASALREMLAKMQRPIAVINTASASAPFISQISSSNRVVVTATKSGNEQNFARFGKYLVEAFSTPASDLDKDGQTSLLEAFLSASSATQEFYKSEGRLATEHALIDDNGDGLGTPSDWFTALRATRKARQGGTPDGFRAHQFHLVRRGTDLNMSPEVRKRRDELELELAHLRDQKASMPEAEYFEKLEKALLRLAHLYAEYAASTNKPSEGVQ